MNAPFDVDNLDLTKFGVGQPVPAMPELVWEALNS